MQRASVPPQIGSIQAVNSTGSRALAGSSASVSLVALQPVVEILHLSVLGAFRQQAFLLQLSDRLAVGRVLVGVDDLRRPVAAAPQCLGKNRFAALALRRSAR